MNYLTATKYPKTYHFEFSDSLQNDDRKLQTLDGFKGKQIIVTEKMDGENATVYSDYYHPRSVRDDGHPSRNWLKGFIPEFQYLIPDGWRVCGENLYAEHSIKYTNLNSYFNVFSIWDNHNMCLDWDTTVQLCKEWGLETVPVLYAGEFDYDMIKQIYTSLDFERAEGIVCRLRKAFSYDSFNTSVGKAVRPKHVSTNEHWKRTWKPNKLK